jgi:hypothetical protein
MTRRRRTRQEWVVEATPDGNATVLRHGRPLRSDVPVEDALRYVRKHRTKNDRVWRQAPDGYRTEITGSL